MPYRLLFLLVLLLCVPAVAGPGESARVLASFDFEERGRGNVEDIPMNWVKLEGPGMPHYVDGQLAADQAHSGKYAFRFDLNGGSLIYRYPHGKLRVHPYANYRISTLVKTAAPLPNARARLTAYFTDIDGHPIKNSIMHSTPYAGDADGWQKLQIELEAGEEAHWLVLELGLVQPSIWRQSTLGDQVLFEQDISGRAWFDDLVVAQVPRARMSTDRPGNIFMRSEPIAMRVRVADRFTDDLVAKLVVANGEGKTVFQQNGTIMLLAQGGESNANAPKLGTVVLPDLPAGWYRVSMQLISQGVVVGDESLDLVRLADDVARVEPDLRFGIVATNLPMQGWGELPALLPHLGAARVKLSVWDGAEDVESRQTQFSALLESLRELHIVPTACLAAPPPKTAAMIGGTSWAHLLKAPAETWQPHLSYMVSRYAGYLDRWQFGLDEQATQFVTDPQMRQAYQTIYNQFATLVAKPDLAMPWPAFFEMEGKLPPTLALSVPSEVLPEQVPLYMQELRKTPGQQLSLSLQLLSRERYGRDAQIRDLVQRVAYALSAGADRIDLPLPFSVRTEAGQLVRQPSELLPVTRTLLMTLGNATYKGQVPVGEDVEAFLFDRHGEGILLMWSKADISAAQSKKVQIVLGRQPRRVDLLGNMSPVLQPRDASGVIDVEVGPMPFMLIGIDGQLAQLRSSFAFDNPLIESSFKPHLRRLRFVNPYPTSISGQFKLRGPTGWTVIPQSPSFSLAPGETYDAPVTIEFPYNSFAGVKAIECDVQLQAGETTNFKVPVLLKLGLGDIGLSTIALRDRNDVIVQQVITNYSGKPVDYSAFAMLPGQARQERLVTNLKPGGTTIKKYRFTNVPFKTGQDQKVRSGVKETEGTRVLNDEVTVQ